MAAPSAHVHPALVRRVLGGRGASWRGGLRAGWMGILLAGLPLAQGAEVPPVLPKEYAVVVTGGELLEGAVSDAHTAFLARILLPFGLHCVQSTLVDDTPDDLRASLEFSSQRADLVLITGGLGPTVNDITREVLSDYTGIPLEESPDILSELSRRFGQPVDQLRDNLRRQARVPLQGSHLANERGTAVGLIFQSGPKTWIALPGPPRELQPMVRDALVPWLRQRLGLPEQGRALTCRFVGLGQSAIDAVLRGDDLLPAGAVVTSQFDGSRVDFTFSFARDTDDARAVLDRLATLIAERLGPYLYSTTGQSLEDVVLERFRRSGRTLVLAECAGPYLASSLSRSTQAGGVLQGGYLAMTAADLRLRLGVADAIWAAGLGSRERVAVLAEAARAATDASCALATSDTAPTIDRDATVWVAFAVSGRPTEVWAHRVRESPEAGRTSLVNEVLNRLRTVPMELQQPQDQQAEDDAIHAESLEGVGADKLE